MDKPLVEMKSIRKNFYAVQAIEHADLALYPGEIHALVGGNGAGKSTLISVLSGAVSPSDGVIRVGEENYRSLSSRSARELGIETIYQNLCLFSDMDIATNLFAGRELYRKGLLGKFGVIDKKAMRRQAAKELERLEVSVPNIRAKIRELSGGQRQCVACARAMMGSAPKVLIMDEPTAALGVRESQDVYRLMGKCRDEGSAVVLISHNMKEVFAVADKITVMLHGVTTAHLMKNETDPEEIVGLITDAIPAESVAYKSRIL